MRRRSSVVLLASLIAATAWSQDVSVYSTTMAQLLKTETPGFEKSTLAPATQWLGIDATGVGVDALSLHLYGWGRTDLIDSTRGAMAGTNGGDITTGYLQYRFAQANAEIKVGRLIVNNAGGFEQLDGFSAQADLIHGFNISAFGGQPVLFKPLDLKAAKDYAYQRDLTYGVRLGWRLPKVGEIGLSYLADGSEPAKNLPKPSKTEYTRQNLGLDLKIAPVAVVDFSGRTVLDLNSHPELPAGTNLNTSSIAEHDYNLTFKVPGLFDVTGSFVERNFRAYFAGSNMPSLFRQTDNDKLRATGASIVWSNSGKGVGTISVVGDYRRTHRETYGDANRYGAELRWKPADTKVQTGFGYHKVSAFDVLLVDSAVPSYSLSHSELRAWVMLEQGAFFASLDGILHNFDDKNNPNLYGQSSQYEVVGSLGYQANANLKVSADVSYGANPLAKKETMGLLRAEFRFGTAGKGGRK